VEIARGKDKKCDGKRQGGQKRADLPDKDTAATSKAAKIVFFMWR
jgi:hypothetical protein